MIKRLWVLYHPEHKLNFRTEVLPYQWRIAVSWVSGYFIFQLFNPVIFAVEGPVAAGKMGMTLAVLNGILSLSLSWFSTRIPVLSGFIARRQFTELDAAFRKIFRQATTVTFFFLLIFVVGVSLMQHLGIPFGERFLSSWPLINMSFCILISSIIYGMAVYLRCHKKEPLLIQSVLMGGLSAVCIVVLGHYYGLTGITISYTILSLVVGLFGTSIIFVHKKKEWHK